MNSSAVARPNGQLRQAGVARGVRGHAPPREILNFSLSEMRFAAFSAFSVLIRRKFCLYIYIFFNCYILATKSFLRGSDDRLCKIKMMGEIRQNFTEASASVGLILTTALNR